MKMAEGHYQQLEDFIRKAIERDGLNSEVTTVAEWVAYQDKAYAQGGHGPTRKMFDALWWTQRHTPGRMDDWYREVYQYCNDDHIGTALKRVWKALGGA